MIWREFPQNSEWQVAKRRTNDNQVHLTNWLDPNRYYHSESAWTEKQWQWSDTSHSPKLRSRSLTIRLFIVISRILMGRLLPLCRNAVSAFYSPSRLSLKVLSIRSLHKWSYCSSTSRSKKPIHSNISYHKTYFQMELSSFVTKCQSKTISFITHWKNMGILWKRILIILKSSIPDFNRFCHEMASPWSDLMEKAVKF